MARGFLRIYRTYSYIDKNPVIDKVRTIIQDEGLEKQLGICSELSSVGRSTIDNWLNGPTRNPQHHTIAAVVTSLGYEEVFTKKKNIDIEKERRVAAKWEMPKIPIPKPAKRKTNGAHKPKRSR